MFVATIVLMVKSSSHLEVHSLQIMHRDVKALSFSRSERRSQGENFLSDRPNIGDPDVRDGASGRSKLEA